MQHEYYNTVTHQTHTGYFKPLGEHWVLKATHDQVILREDEQDVSADTSFGDSIMSGIVAGISEAVVDSVFNSDTSSTPDFSGGGGDFGGGGSSSDW